MKKKNGFTLIELLAVIIILGILMIIAIPSVTKYISDSRKSAYVDTAKEIISGTRNLVNEGNLEMYDTSATYYIPVDYIKTENSLKSPYGEFTEAYVGVIYDGKGYKYYWISVDDSGQGVSNITLSDNLDLDDIKSDLKNEDILNTIEHTVIGNRNKILVLDSSTETWHEVTGGISSVIPEETIDNVSLIVYPNGKDKSSVVIGDLVKVNNEDFYVIKELTDDKLTLISRYNLNVGNDTIDNNIGKQNSNVIGWNSNSDFYYGTGEFAYSNYWDNNGTIKPYYSGSYDNPNYPYVYNNESCLYSFLINYASVLKIPIKEIRLLKYSEAINLGCSQSNNSCSSAPSFLYNTSFWLGNATSSNEIAIIASSGDFSSETITNKFAFGIRPVIVI